MKKLLLTALATASFGLAANAQLAVGSVAPDFTLTDIDGVTHHLYNYLDSGYAVIIDVSAAWCGPCWSAHTSHVFENLTDHYGPNGTTTPKKVKVIFIEGESANTTAQLHGTSSGTSTATFSQGDWVAGTNYPIIDDATQNTNYLYGGFPSFTIICRDRLVAYADAGYGSNMGQESFWMNIINAGCPSTAPASGSGVDAKAVAYSGSEFFICSANPTVKFQNYSSTANITNATIKVYSGSTVVATQPWTGNLAPYGVASVAVSSFTPSSSQTGPFNFDVTVSGDANAANNGQNDIFDVITAANATTVPFSENFESSTAMPAKFHPDATGGFFFVDGTASPAIVGANGSNTKCVVVNYYNLTAGTNSELILSNYNNQSAAHSSFEFDLSHAQYVATGAGSNDKLEIFVSTNCGQSWTSVWSKAGATLKTHDPVGNNTEYIPAAAADWRHEGVSLDAYKSNNLFIKFKMTSDYGNYGFLDNFKVTNTTSVEEVIADNSVQVYPNPTTDVAHVTFSVTKASNVTIQVTDVMGRVVSNVANENMAAGAHKVDIQTANLPAGVYNIKIQTEAGSRTERLTVAK